jgi:hypothetical protein
MEQPPARQTRRRRWLWVLSVIAVFAVLGLVNSLVRQANRNDPLPSAPTTNTDPMLAVTEVGHHESTVFTYFFYWYDATTGAHLQPESGQPLTLPPDPPPTWRSAAWFRKQLTDMSEAGVDVALPVYWGNGEEWSIGGLTNLSEAKRQLEAEGQHVPDVGMFFDTTILNGGDLTHPIGKQLFYAAIKLFFDEFPRDQWALIDGRPVIWLYFSFFADSFDQSTFDYVYDSFQQDFGVRPYIVRELTWDFAKINGDYVDDQPIATEANYKWGAALDGYSDRGSVAAVGPGFDERDIPGRGDAHRSRDDGRWYRENFERAIASGKPFLVIETWNEIHEASGIQDTLEFGRQYIEATRILADQFKRNSSQSNEGR